MTDLARFEKKIRLACEVEALRNGPTITAQRLREAAPVCRRRRAAFSTSAIRC
ncbi:hypothetical protein ACFRFL_25355 [Streptomyces sp. NPDC056708]|uniref:hypothetical protein n=1 Tax=unclassified Streptomyces TaxID=2593676 RepID=UPI0036868D6C